MGGEGRGEAPRGARRLESGAEMFGEGEKMGEEG